MALRATRRAVIGSIPNPSAAMPQEVHVANNARIGVQRSLYGDFSRTEGEAARTVTQAFEASPPTYLGKDASAVVGTAVDFLERPAQYTNVSPELAAAKYAWGQAQLDNLNRVRAQYKTEILPHTPADPGGVYVPHVTVKDDIERAVQATSTSLTSRASLTRARAYDTLHDRLLKRPDFVPETDLSKLADVHANSLAYVAGNNTFKEGIGGLTKTEVMRETHPQLAARMDGLLKTLDGLRGTKTRLDSRLARTIRNLTGLDPALPLKLGDQSAAAVGHGVTEQADTLTHGTGVEVPGFSQLMASLPDLHVIQGQIDVLRGQLTRDGSGAIRRNRANTDLVAQIGHLEAAAEVRGAINQANGDIARATELMQESLSGTQTLPSHARTPDCAPRSTRTAGGRTGRKTRTTAGTRTRSVKAAPGRRTGVCASRSRPDLASALRTTRSSARPPTRSISS
jgi:hypothetical protein